MDEHRLTVSRSARYYTLGQAGRSLREAWFLCHGYGELAQPFLRRFESLDDGTRLLVAPEGLSRFYLDSSGGRQAARVGASWMTREDRDAEISDYLAYVDAVRDQCLASPTHGVTIRILGFSQGAATAARWAAHGRVAPAEVILYGGILPPELEPRVLKARHAGLRITYVVGDRDDFLDHASQATQAATCEAAGLITRVIRFEGGHRIDTSALRQLEGIP